LSPIWNEVRWRVESGFHRESQPSSLSHSCREMQTLDCLQTLSNPKNCGNLNEPARLS